MVNYISLIIAFIALSLIFVFPLGILVWPLAIMIICCWCSSSIWAATACKKDDILENIQYFIPGWGGWKLTKSAYDEDCVV